AITSAGTHSHVKGPKIVTPTARTAATAGQVTTGKTTHTAATARTHATVRTANGATVHTANGATVRTQQVAAVTIVAPRSHPRAPTARSDRAPLPTRRKPRLR